MGTRDERIGENRDHASVCSALVRDGDRPAPLAKMSPRRQHAAQFNVPWLFEICALYLRSAGRSRRQQAGDFQTEDLALKRMEGSFVGLILLDEYLYSLEGDLIGHPF
jgi:hypothetical protein